MVSQSFTIVPKQFWIFWVSLYISLHLTTILKVYHNKMQINKCLFKEKAEPQVNVILTKLLWFLLLVYKLQFPKREYVLVIGWLLHTRVNVQYYKYRFKGMALVSRSVYWDAQIWSRISLGVLGILVLSILLLVEDFTNFSRKTFPSQPKHNNTLCIYRYWYRYRYR